MDVVQANYFVVSQQDSTDSESVGERASRVLAIELLGRVHCQSLMPVQIGRNWAFERLPLTCSSRKPVAGALSTLPALPTGYQ